MKTLLCTALLILTLALPSTFARADNDYAPIKVPPPKAELPVTFKKDTLAIEKKDGAPLTFFVELAQSPTQQARGLMQREFMADDAGMLFVFEKEGKRSFWMKDTLIPLDLLFIAEDGEITHIHHHAKPLDETRITSERPALAVLEINGGMADKLGIKPGDKVIYETFQNDMNK